MIFMLSLDSHEIQFKIVDACKFLLKILLLYYQRIIVWAPPKFMNESTHVVHWFHFAHFTIVQIDLNESNSLSFNCCYLFQRKQEH